MAQIVSLSKFGFKLDSLKNEWVKIDKSLLNREIFLLLNKGEHIEILSTNDKGFVTDFKMIDAPILRVHDSQMSLTDRKILKGQCLNIVAMNTHANLENKDARANLIDTAHKLYQEILDAEFEKW